MSDDNPVVAKTMTVLCVDDEINILKSMKRLLFKQDYQVLLAESGSKALEILKQTEVHVVISDMKMPGMSGVELLENIATNYPSIHRVLLTGYADIQSTIDAVNKGKIHRYFQKPWDNDEIVQAINEGLETVRLQHENSRLQVLIKKQNLLLKGLNQNLEDKVQLRTKQINLALKKIERNNSATQKVLYNLISINPNLNGGFANSISLLATRIAEQLALPKQQLADVTFAALICEIGLLGLDTAIYSKAYSELNYNQQVEYLGQTKIAQLILSPAHNLDAVSDIVTGQFECLNGSGPNKLVGAQIPIGAKILAVARDYWRYTLGRITPEKMDDREVRTEMKKFLGSKYDPEILNILLNNESFASDEFIEKSIAIDSLVAGMVLKYNLFTEAHILVLPEGHTFTDNTITKLMKFEKSQSSPLSIIVDEPIVDT